MICAAQRAQRGSRVSYPIGYYHELAGGGGGHKQNPADYPAQKVNISSSLEINNTQNWVLEDASPNLITRAEQCSLIFYMYM